MGRVKAVSIGKLCNLWVIDLFTLVNKLQL